MANLVGLSREEESSSQTSVARCAIPSSDVSFWETVTCTGNDMSRRNIVVCLSSLKRPFMIPQTRFSNSSNAPVNPEPCFACDFYCHPQTSSSSTRFYVAAIPPADSCSDWPPFNVDSSLANNNAGGREGSARISLISYHKQTTLPTVSHR